MGCAGCGPRVVGGGGGGGGIRRILAGGVHRWSPDGDDGGSACPLPASKGDCGCGCGGAPGAVCPSAGSLSGELNGYQRAVMQSRAAGLLMDVPGPTASDDTTRVNRNFRRSSPADLVALTDLDLYERETNLREINFHAGTPASVQSEYRAELALVRDEAARRDREPGGAPYGGADASDEEEAAAEGAFDGMTREEKRRLLESTAREVAPGTDAASARRRDAIILRGLSEGFATFNRWLDTEYGTRIATINGDTSITLTRLRYEDRERQRVFDLERLRLRGGGGSGGGGGGGGGGGSGGGSGGGALPILGLLGLAFSVMK